MLQTACAIASYPGGGHDRADVLRAGDDVCALVMADGMGGRSGAARAAEMWVEAVRVRAAQDQAKWAESDYWLDLMATPIARSATMPRPARRPRWRR